MDFSYEIDSMTEMMYAMMNLCACMWVLGLFIYLFIFLIIAINYAYST